MQAKGAKLWCATKRSSQRIDIQAMKNETTVDSKSQSMSP